MTGRRQGIVLIAAIGTLALAATAWATFPSVNVDHDPPLLSVDDTNPVTHVNDLTVDIDQDLIRIAEATFPPASDDAECLERYNDGSSLTLHCDPTGIDRLEIMLRDGEDTLDLSLGDLRGLITQLARGGAGNDELRGRSGTQKLIGGDGHDDLLGGRGPDRLNGKAGRDELYGGPGDDVLNGGGGLDICLGGGGDDVRIDCEQTPVPVP